MKKLIVLSLLCIFACTSYAQNVEDVWLLLKNGNTPAAKKKIDECMPTNQDNPRAWLYRGNAYLMVYIRDEKRKEADASYVSKTPDAIYIAYESFYRSMELNGELVIEGILNATDGQKSCGGPLYNLGYAAYQNNDYDNTVKYLNAAIKCMQISGDRESKGYIGDGYFFLYDITQKQKGADAALEVLDRGVKAQTGVPVVYQLAYDAYSKRQNWEKCDQILKTAKKDVPAKELGSIYTLELNYASATNDTARFNKAMLKVQENVDNEELVSEAAGYLTDGGKYEEAIELLTKCGEKNPNSFTVFSQMAYVYSSQSNIYVELANTAVNNGEYDKATQYRNEQTECFNKAHDWCEKAFQVNPKDVRNAMMLKQLKLYTGKEVPAELEEVCKQAGQN